MANQEHLAIFKQSVDAWNTWVIQHLDVRPDLSNVDLSNVDLSNVDLSNVDLSNSNLFGSYLGDANLSGALFLGANLSNAHMSDADLSDADLSNANLIGADLSGANLSNANLSNANLGRAILSGASLRRANLNGADLKLVRVGNTIFGEIDLSVAKRLETVRHDFPSTLGIDTIILSQGKIPEIFLRKIGIPGSIIQAIPSLVSSLRPIDFYSCFISYSSKDQVFAERLYADLQSKGVRCWFAPEDLKIGDKIRPRIDEAIRIHDKLLIVLSEHSVESIWVEKEVETAFEKEPAC